MLFVGHLNVNLLHSPLYKQWIIFVSILHTHNEIFVGMH